MSGYLIKEGTSTLLCPHCSKLSIGSAKCLNEDCAPPPLRYGDTCRVASCGAPALYFGGGKALWVSVMTNELVVGNAAPSRGDEEDCVLPTPRELQGAAEAYRIGLRDGLATDS